MEPRFFSVEEANKELPRIKNMFDEIFHLNTSIKNITKDVQELVDIWGEDVTNPRNIDNKFYIEKIDKRAKFIDDLQLSVEEISKAGCVVKDIDIGLVDFFHKKDDDIMFLCWRYGEEKIGYWHHVNVGFANRRPIEELSAII